MISRLPEIRHNKNGFDTLTRLAEETKKCLFDDINIDMSNTVWFDADMCAPFGALLYRIGKNLNSIKLINIKPDIEEILTKNGFLGYYGRKKMPDRWGTTIPYRLFDVKDDRFFADYIENELIHRKEMPNMSLGLLKKFRESIFEIFSNAVLHSRTKLGIFCCGQHFPNRQRLDFAVADLGVGMRQNIKDYASLDLSATDAIDWATKGTNTTKRGAVPGGLGLKLLCEFIDLNGGSIQIVSDAGYWRRKNRNTTSASFAYPFPGTVVNLEINTADTSSYTLVSKLDTADIF